ncbi:MAG TPA: dTMP kinase, partial [Janibacter terrae]|nr:dTMP kinase [Janibacter terrae]
DAFHAAVREHFLAMAKGEPHRYLVVDGTASPDEIAERVHARLVDEGVL